MNMVHYQYIDIISFIFPFPFIVKLHRPKHNVFEGWLGLTWLPLLYCSTGYSRDLWKVSLQQWGTRLCKTITHQITVQPDSFHGLIGLTGHSLTLLLGNNFAFLWGGGQGSNNHTKILHHHFHTAVGVVVVLSTALKDTTWGKTWPSVINEDVDHKDIQVKINVAKLAEMPHVKISHRQKRNITKLKKTENCCILLAPSYLMCADIHKVFSIWGSGLQ